MDVETNTCNYVCFIDSLSESSEWSNDQGVIIHIFPKKERHTESRQLAWRYTANKDTELRTEGSKDTWWITWLTTCHL